MPFYDYLFFFMLSATSAASASENVVLDTVRAIKDQSNSVDIMLLDAAADQNTEVLWLIMSCILPIFSQKLQAFLFPMQACFRERVCF